MFGWRDGKYRDRVRWPAVLLLVIPLIVFPARAVGADRSETVRNLRIEGNSSLSDGELLTVIKTRKGELFDDVLFRKDLVSIIEHYVRRGYLRAEIVNSRVVPVSDKGVTKYDLEIMIYEDQPARISSVSVSGIAVLDSVAVMSRVTLRAGDILSMAAVERVRRSLLDFYLRKGYVHCRVSATPSFSEDNRQVALTFDIAEGPLVRVGEIRIIGNEQVRRRIISRELRFSPGDVLDVTRIEEDKTRLYATRVFRDVRINLDNFTDTTTVAGVTVQVREADMRWVDMKLGHGQTRRLQAEVEWGHNNLFNNNQRLSLRLRGSAKSLSVKDMGNRAILNYTEPWFLGFRVKGISELFHQNEEIQTLLYSRDELTDTISREPVRTMVNETGASLALAKEVGRTVETKVTAEYKYVDIALKSNPTNTNKIGWALAYDTRDDLFEPSRGSFDNLSVELAGGPLLGGSNDFYRVVLDMRRFLPLYRNHSLALHLRLGQITSYGTSEHVPEEEHFWGVGLNLFRGHRIVRPGTFNVVTNLEYRFPLLRGFRGVVFSDIGQIAQSRSAFFADTHLAYSLGFGLRYPTPMGPVRLDFGVPLLDRRLYPSKTILQFGFGHAF